METIMENLGKYKINFTCLLLLFEVEHSFTYRKHELNQYNEP